MTGHTSFRSDPEFTRGREFGHDLVAVPNPTATHLHPEHAFGAQVSAGKTTSMVNRQVDDLARQSRQDRVPADARG